MSFVCASNLGWRSAHLTAENSFKAESDEFAFCSDALLITSYPHVPTAESVLRKGALYLSVSSFSLFLHSKTARKAKGECDVAVVVLHVCLAALDLCDFWLGEGVEELCCEDMGCVHS